MARKGLLVDFGGVLTTNVFAAFAGFCEREGLDPEHVRLAFRENDGARSLLFELELGRIEEHEFARGLAVALGLGDGRAETLIEDLWADIEPDGAMIEAVARFREAGIRTGLVSNSWGTALKYETELMDRLFDTAVISHLVGMRKPDPEIYQLAAERIGLPFDELVFIDDLAGNLKPARAMGMATVRHSTAEESIPQLEELLGVRVAG